MATPPGGPIEICFSFDTTGSMSSSIDAVKNNVQDMIQRLQADIPGIRIAVFAHGDYCDKGRSYVTNHIDFSTDAVRLCQWIKNVGSTGGGDSDECYELVLHEVQSLSWTPGTQRVLVMIGDACPHEPNYPQNTLKLNWRDEIEKLALMGLRIYAVQCRSWNDKRTDDFYKALADKTAGRRLELDQFSNLFDFIMAICYREHGAEFLDIYEKEVRARDARLGVHKDVDAMFGALRDTSTSSLPPITKHPSLPKVNPKSLPFKPAMKKVPSLTKSSSISSLKKKTSIYKSKKTIAKRIKSVDLDQKKLKLLSKAKVNNLRKLKRENVAETNFSLNRMLWTPWEAAIISSKPDDEDSWEERRGGAKGYRKSLIFGGKMQPAALYEFSVRSEKDGTRCVMYNKLSKGFVNASCWESRLLGEKGVRSQINNVLARDCAVFVRRSVVKEGSKSYISRSLKRYDYAWRRIHSLRNTPKVQH